MVSPEPFLRLWPETTGRSARLINHTENHTFLVDGGFILRVHPATRSRDAIGDELAWVRALRESTHIALPEQVGTVGEAGGRPAVLFRQMPGVEPEPSASLFEALGTWAAMLHSRTIPAPHRPVWGHQLLDADGPWGDWRTVDASVANVDAELRTRLAAYGTTPDRFGLIHADMRLANVLDDNGRYALIDFDDCGHGWFMYDFGSAVSFVDADDRLPTFRDAWLRGYERVRALSASDIAMLGPMVLLRRMALLAWMGEHRDTILARDYLDGFAADTLRLADALL